MGDSGNAPHWELAQLYRQGSPELESDMAKIRELSASFPRWKPRIEAEDFDNDDFRELMGELSSIQELASKLGGYSGLYFSEDTSNQKAQAFVGVVEHELVGLENSLLFFELWWKDLPDARASAFMDAVPGLRYYLERLRAFKPHTLSEPEERIINQKNATGPDAMVILYDTITNGYRFSTDYLPGGGAGDVTREELMVHVRDHLPEVREGAYKEFYRVFSKEGPTLALIFQNLARDFRTENVSLRGYRDPRAVRNHRNDLPDGVVASLLRVCAEEAPRVFGEWFRRKAAALGMGRLRRYDIYAPLAKPKEEDIPFEAALSEVREAFGAFSPKMADLAMRIDQARHLSARKMPGKESGAYCASLTPGEPPWVLMTYKGRRQDMFTLAHELGHAVHSQLAADKGIFQYHAALPLAETASTFGEMLLGERLRQGDLDEPGRRDLAAHLMDDAYATVGRQAFFSLFESVAHEMAAKGATATEISDSYLGNLRTQFGDSIDVSPEFAWEWVSIPHFFHTPFYVYAYSFGQLLVYSLFRRYQLEGPKFVPAFLRILELGGSLAPADILSEAGVGPLDDAFWKGGFQVIEGLMEGL
ncbi:MAG: M3 family oligoendopeptidase [Deltaproteobacteria bacterium]|jgi:oligoendopeptidase F|nr:M3 family oligoendopeptidase [Deltaproteobacteria bacterium]